ncbi:RAM signaling pathway protein-domain-containing protein [Podospora australis]|uniref:RAM signaling pathway protein-domain-containing protein n=1 Tax=Podospora australis TaxID=1536484 RepID=A0AAN6WXP9_9PEZI|nr:RAM signaling pathway protein-domain-containing protein [Podospora australis]
MMEYPRGLPDNPAHARRAVAAAALANPVPPPPVPSLRDASSSGSLSASQPLSSTQVLNLAREAMRAAHENEAKAAAASGVSNTLKPGLTIDLSRKKIHYLPDEIVDIIKDELERLALSHNNLESFPTRFAECTSLRYLNVRQNKIKEFPLALCDLKSLEILDLGRNMLQSLPPEIVKLSSLKVFSVQKNQISELPLCLAEMPSLSVIKLEGNPLIFPSPEVVQGQEKGGSNDYGITKESDLTEVAVTTRIKKFLKKAAAASLSGRSETDSPSDDPSEGTETPRPTIKRVFSGRFPIRINGSDVPDLRSPALPRAGPPPVPSRSHYRGLSQQNTAQRRPGVMPLTIGNPNERVRSNSETIVQTSSRERSESRSRRMGIVSKRSELSTLEENDGSNRFSHYRGLSHGSAMQQGNGQNIQANSPNVVSPADSASAGIHRPVYVRRLSILPERRRESKIYDPVLEAAKGILYAIFQIHPMVQMLIGLANDGTAGRSNLEIVFYATNGHVEQLELEIQKHDQSSDDGYGPRENENVQRACKALMGAYAHVCSLLMQNVDRFLENGDPRYIRTLLTQLYNSIMELRVTCSQVVARDNGQQQRSLPHHMRMDPGETLRPHSRENSVTPTADRPLLNGRPRNGTFVYNPSNLRVATDVGMGSYVNGSRTAIMSAVTPRSGESFASNSTSGMRNLSVDFTEEDRIFERIFLSLQKTSDQVMRIVPALGLQFTASMRAASAQRATDHVMQCWKGLVARCNAVIQATEVLKAKLSTIHLKEPGIRTQQSFWGLCSSFMDAWYFFVKRIQAVHSDIQLPSDTKPRLKPVHASIKETCDLMHSSPWSYFTRQPSEQPIPSPYSAQSGTPGPLPMTPQSAALGPAVQATVPSTPSSASFAQAFQGDVFQRAETLLSMGGLGMSRHGTMNSGSTASLTTASLHSVNSSQDGIQTPNSALSPGGPFPPHGGHHPGHGHGSSAGSLGPLPLRLGVANGKMNGF